MTVHFDQVAPKLAELVAAGASFDSACDSVGVSPNTGRSWLRKGRRDPDGRYGALAAAIDACRAAQVVALDGGAAMTLEEWEVHLAEAIRAGSVPAMKLYAETHRESEPARVDPFAEFDELAQRRKDKGHA
ncbi:MAG TPA: hypothetical protein VMU64_07000 [Acidimicrobiales bacterium]|nr:hypothetical protein [Acidimicrobiales bacterium]